jgi:hypothetical protein
MTRIVLRAVKAGLAVSAAAATLALTTAGGHALLLDVYLLCMGGIVLLALVRATRARAWGGGGSQFERALAATGLRPPESAEPHLTREVELSTFNALHLHVRLRPVLRDIAANRLRSRYGVDLDGEPARARELVGSATWELVRPDRPAPEDRLARGPSVAELERIVDQLEAI